MSTALSALLPERSPEERPERHLRPLDRPRSKRRPKLVYGITAVVGALVIGGAQMGFSLLSTQTTYQIRDLTEQQRALTLQGQALYDEVAGLGSPQYLASNATAAGMIVGGAPTYLRLSDGHVSGAGEAAAESSINAKKSAVPNNLIANTPLVTNPGLTISGKTAPVPVAVDEPTGPVHVDELPTPVQVQKTVADPKPESSLDDGLPTPQTH